MELILHLSHKKPNINKSHRKKNENFFSLINDKSNFRRKQHIQQILFIVLPAKAIRTLKAYYIASHKRKTHPFRATFPAFPFIFFYFPSQRVGEKNRASPVQYQYRNTSVAMVSFSSPFSRSLLLKARQHKVMS